MSSASTSTQPLPVVLDFGSILDKMSDREFFDFCQRNKDWRIERTSEGELVIMAPTGGITGNRNYNLIGLFREWAVKDGTGIGFDSSTCFTLPNRAKRSPDLSWIKLSRWEKLTEDEQEMFPPICPDFVVELRSRSDNLEMLKEKMEEYIANGVKLGWLIDPQEKLIYVYRPKKKVVIHNNPKTISGDPVLRGFVLAMEKIW